MLQIVAYVDRVFYHCIGIKLKPIHIPKFIKPVPHRKGKTIRDKNRKHVAHNKKTSNKYGKFIGLHNYE